MRHKLLLFVVLCGLFGAGLVVWKVDRVESPGQINQIKPPPAGPVRFDKSQYSLSDPASNWVVVNKQHPLSPKDYTPTDLVFPAVSLRVPGHESMQLRQSTASALVAMFKAAATEGVDLTLSSGYRSYTYQVGLYGGYVKAQGQATADTQSARPGYSEHQTGLAADVEPADRSCELQACFGETPAGKWLSTHAFEYGFIIRYLDGKQDITGYEPEPWHLRFVGSDLANEMHRTNTSTLEEFFGVSGGKVYSE